MGRFLDWSREDGEDSAIEPTQPDWRFFVSQALTAYQSQQFPTEEAAMDFLESALFALSLSMTTGEDDDLEAWCSIRIDGWESA